MAGRYEHRGYDPSKPDFKPYAHWTPDPIADLTLRARDLPLDAARTAGRQIRDFVARGGLGIDWYLHTAEAAASTTVEGVFPDLRSMLRFESTGQGGADERSAKANIDALQTALDVGAAGGPLSLENSHAIHVALIRALPATESDGIAAGRLRTDERVVAQRDAAGNIRVYSPPLREDVAPLLNDWLLFCNRSDLDPFVKSVVAHAQFELIHPYGDGNGRTGRALLHAMWGKDKLIAGRRTVPVSGSLAQDKSGYQDALAAFETARPLHDDPAPIRGMIYLFADAIDAAVERGTRLRASLAEVSLDLRSRHRIRRGSLLDRVVDGLLVRPSVAVSDLCNSYDASERQARRVIDRLLSASVLTEFSVNPTTAPHAQPSTAVETVYEATPILDAFADAMKGTLELRNPELPHLSATPQTFDAGLRVAHHDDINYDIQHRQGDAVCGVWMKKARARCVLRAGHAGPHRSRR